MKKALLIISVLFAGSALAAPCVVENGSAFVWAVGTDTAGDKLLNAGGYFLRIPAGQRWSGEKVIQVNHIITWVGIEEDAEGYCVLADALIKKAQQPRGRDPRKGGL